MTSKRVRPQMGSSASSTTTYQKRDVSNEPPRTTATAGRSINGGTDSLNETKMSFAAGIDFNAAVKFNAKETQRESILLPADTESEHQPYYTFSNTNRTQAFPTDPVAA